MRCYQPVSFLGVLDVLIIGIGLLDDAVVLVVVVALPGPVSTGFVAGFQLPVVIVVISGAEVVVVAYCAPVLPGGASVTGDVVVVLVVASPEEDCHIYIMRHEATISHKDSLLSKKNCTFRKNQARSDASSDEHSNGQGSSQRLLGSEPASGGRLIYIMK